MRHITLSIACIIATSTITLSANASHWVHSYYRSNGTYVQGHESMDPGESKRTGWSYHNNRLVPRGDYNDNAGFNTPAPSDFNINANSSSYSGGNASLNGTASSDSLNSY